ncbi:MAG: hypothetical protein ABMB14_11305 [Myxococcota bacterium]
MAWILAWVLASCSSEGDDWCDCVIANDCWDSAECPEDPVGSCLWYASRGPVPSYAGQDSEVCFAVVLECYEPVCGSPPEGDG